MPQDASSLRKTITKMDIDPGYFSKFMKDQIVLKFIQDHMCRSILDIGCDTCYIYEILSERQHHISRYVGMDKNKTSFTTLSDNFNFIQAKNLIDDMKYYLKRNVTTADPVMFDIVLLLDVIEHMQDKAEGWRLIEQSMTHLDKGGYMIISTPNCMDNTINWPKYHTYEYNIDELINHMPDDMRLIFKAGWSMSNRMFLDVNDANSIEQYGLVVPIEISRVMMALAHPEYSRDIILIYQKT